jgi:hypothetical protein
VVRFLQQVELFQWLMKLFLQTQKLLGQMFITDSLAGEALSTGGTVHLTLAIL